jgi:hypothetical protein
MALVDGSGYGSVVRALLILAAVLGCQGGGASDSSPAPPGPSSASARPSGTAARAGNGVGRARDAAVAVEVPDDVKPEEPDPVDVGKAIADLGAIPAWQAVVDRAQYLARRGQQGVVFGTLGSAIQVAAAGDAGFVASPYTWLVDDTEGNGSLAIRVALDGTAPPSGGAAGGAQVPAASKAKPGDRIAIRGAWALDDERRWYWRADDVTALPPAPPPNPKDGPPAAPGHKIVDAGVPPGTKRISKAGDGDFVFFQLVGAPPAIDGDGWPVADELGNPVAVLLNLPGEHASYGAQDMRTADERWQLKRGSVYVVRVGIVHHHGPDKPATMNAKTAPVKVR